MKSNRKLRNVNMTSAFHYRHNGIWIAVSLFLVALANVLWITMILIHPTTTFTPRLQLALAAEIVLAFVFIIGLAKFTSHRVAGPYIALEKICQRVAGGETSARVRFRSSDHLNDLERAFNAMLDTLTAEAELSEPVQLTDPAPIHADPRPVHAT